MFYVVNLETRNVLTYRGGDRCVYTNYDIAWDDAYFAQRYNNHAHAVVSITDVANQSLGREIKPWLANNYVSPQPE